MILPDTPRRFTVEEYLLIERAAEAKSEYIDGQIFAMTGASRSHNLIAGNASGALRDSLRGGPCEVYQSDMRVEVADTGLYAYPDVTVACPPIDWSDDRTDMLRNPVLIIEVLSPSTAGYDRGEKFLRYQRLPSLMHYLLVEQSICRVEHFRRHEQGWLLESHEDLDDRIVLDALDVRLDLRTVYERVL